MYVLFLGQENPLKKDMAIHSSVLAWKSHGQRSRQATVHRVARSRHKWETKPPPSRYKCTSEVFSLPFHNEVTLNVSSTSHICYWRVNIKTRISTFFRISNIWNHVHGQRHGKMNGVEAYYYISILPFGANNPLILEIYLHTISSEGCPDVVVKPSLSRPSSFFSANLSWK